MEFASPLHPRHQRNLPCLLSHQASLPVLCQIWFPNHTGPPLEEKSTSATPHYLRVRQIHPLLNQDQRSLEDFLMTPYSLKTQNLAIWKEPYQFTLGSPPQSLFQNQYSRHQRNQGRSLPLPEQGGSPNCHNATGSVLNMLFSWRDLQRIQITLLTKKP